MKFPGERDFPGQARQAVPGRYSTLRRRLIRQSPLLLLGSLTWLSASAAGTESGEGSTGSSGTSTEGAKSNRMLTVYTFGDSILDCGHYNVHGVHPGQLLVRNDDRLFPAFKGRDLVSRGPARLVHRAVDGATVTGLASQTRSIGPDDNCAALLTVGGNDLIRGLAGDSGAGIAAFERMLEQFLTSLPLRPVLLGTVYDPTFGDDSRNFLGVSADIARANHRRVNDIIAAAGERYGRTIDLHRHFLQGDPGWFVHTIEPSLIGASEVRRAFLEAF